MLPVDGPSLEHGCVVVRGDRILAVGPTAVVAEGRRVDFGDAVITPGFVNAHAHLEFSLLRQPLGEAGLPFADWILEVLEYRRSLEFHPAAATLAGLKESVEHGVTTIGDIASCVPDLLFEKPPVGVDVTSFIELIGLSEERAASQLRRLDELEAPNIGTSSVRRGISPHAPYTVRGNLFEAAVRASKRLQLPLAFHLAESREELRLLDSHDGPLADYLGKLGAWDDAAIPRGTRPLDYLRVLQSAARSLIVHGNYLQDDELDFIGGNSERMAVVYCPRTHAYFGHEPHPLPKLLERGAVVALGTDGRCTNPDLNLRAELRHVAQVFPMLTPETILQLGTLNGARAIGLAGECGSLSPGKRADFLVFADDRQERNACAVVVCGDSPLAAVYYGGRRLAAE
ncbi:MAG: amidohydrolase family protein [Planctomycetes bacterium]|nr:amidohydrolase family protein [Planctomycetota bacterium]